MPHDFDYQTVQLAESVSAADTTEDPERATLGPDSDEVWDVLDIYLEGHVGFSGTATDQEVGEYSVQVATGIGRMFAGPISADTPGLVSQYTEDSPRVLWARAGQASQPVEDETNGTGAGGQDDRWSQHLRFDEGDLRIAFPGDIQYGVSGSTSANTIDIHATMAVHYRPSPRHQ